MPPTGSFTDVGLALLDALSALGWAVAESTQAVFMGLVDGVAALLDLPVEIAEGLKAMGTPFALLMAGSMVILASGTSNSLGGPQPAFTPDVFAGGGAGAPMMQAVPGTPVGPPAEALHFHGGSPVRPWCQLPCPGTPVVPAPMEPAMRTPDLAWPSVRSPVQPLIAPALELALELAVEPAMGLSPGPAAGVPVGACSGVQAGAYYLADCSAIPPGTASPCVVQVTRLGASAAGDVRALRLAPYRNGGGVKVRRAPRQPEISLPVGLLISGPFELTSAGHLPLAVARDVLAATDQGAARASYLPPQEAASPPTARPARAPRASRASVAPRPARSPPRSRSPASPRRFRYGAALSRLDEMGYGESRSLRKALTTHEGNIDAVLHELYG